MVFLAKLKSINIYKKQSLQNVVTEMTKNGLNIGKCMKLVLKYSYENVITLIQRA